MKNKEVQLSILIPTYNREKFISTAIDSILNQNFSDFEIICSDNASTDKTYEILLNFEKKDDRIKVFRNEKNLGPIINWKYCLDKACGKFIHWLWSDDWIESNFYIDAFELMHKDKTKVVTTWNYRSDNLEDTDDKYISWQFSYAMVPGKVAAKKILLSTYELPVSPAAYILPTDLVRKHFYMNIPKISNIIDPVNKGVGVDSLMIAGVCQNVSNVSVLQKPSVVFRQHNNLSVQLGKNGSLEKMYFFSHLWFISNNAINLSISDVLSLIFNVMNKFPKDFFNPKIMNSLFKIIRNSLFSGSIDDMKYQSKKVFFKRKKIAYLSKNMNAFNLYHKIIYLAPLNDITEALYSEFEKLNPNSITFIDNFKEGSNIIKQKDVTEYDYIFIFSPNYQKEIAKELPKKNIYSLYHEKNQIYDALPYNTFNRLKQNIYKVNLLLYRDFIQKLSSYFKNINMFSIGSQIIYLSENFKKIDIHNKEIYLSPLNNITEELYLEFKKLKPKKIKFIDDLKNEDNVVKQAELGRYDYIFIYSLNNKKEMAKQMPKKNIFFLYHKRKRGFDALPLNTINILKNKTHEMGILFYLNSIHRIRLFFANKIKFPVHINEKKIMDLKNKHKGKRAFIIGSGPSLTVSDLDKLKDEITFAANKIFLAYDETNWRPTYYTVEDNLVIHEIYNEVSNLKGSTIILPFKDIKEYNIIKNAIYYPLVNNKNNSVGCSDNMLSGIFPGHTVTYSMLQMAIFMGIKELYLIGIDFSYDLPPDVSKNGDTIYHSKEKNHFHKSYRNVGDKWIKPNYAKQIEAYESALDFCNENGIKIYNASRKTKLDVFEKINFDELLRE